VNLREIGDELLRLELKEKYFKKIFADFAAALRIYERWRRKKEHVSMKITLSSSYYLTDELGKEPRVVNRRTGDNYGPDDIVAWHPTGDLQRCRHLVRRAAARLKLTEEQRVMVSQFIGPGRPLSDNLPAIDSIHLRVTTERKSTYVHAAQARRLKLSEWMQNACDRAVGR
jgi:hypothetical protein